MAAEWKRETEGVGGFWLKGKEKWGGVRCGWHHVEEGGGGSGAVAPRGGGRLGGGGGLAADGVRTGGTRDQPTVAGVGGSERERGSAARGADRRAR
jgi:hypothetical protein